MNSVYISPINPESPIVFHVWTPAVRYNIDGPEYESGGLASTTYHDFPEYRFPMIAVRRGYQYYDLGRNVVREGGNGYAADYFQLFDRLDILGPSSVVTLESDDSLLGTGGRGIVVCETLSPVIGYYRGIEIPPMIYVDDDPRDTQETVLALYGDEPYRQSHLREAE